GGNAMPPLLLGGFVLGALAIFAVRPLVARRYGGPTRRQIRLMLAAVAFELAGLVLLSWLTSNGTWSHDPQFIWTSVLVIVALHFLLMVWSFSPWALYMGVAILAWIALALTLHLDLGVIILGDGLLLLGFGAIMAAPLFLRPKPKG